ncbi:hypothetical protein, partial [Wolbachia endosymbiont of Atemnus politus]|uniref:hypothetical protein n=1 Tax=Wolbachia endosymbiont of Atemnus politus TaxID=2682840 RepID=UPI001C551C58
LIPFYNDVIPVLGSSLVINIYEIYQMEKKGNPWVSSYLHLTFKHGVLLFKTSHNRDSVAFEV